MVANAENVYVGLSSHFRTVSDSLLRVSAVQSSRLLARRHGQETLAGGASRARAVRKSGEHFVPGRTHVSPPAPLRRPDTHTHTHRFKRHDAMTHMPRRC